MSSLPAGGQDIIKQQLHAILARSGLPPQLVERLLIDSDGAPHYRRVADVRHLDAQPENSSYWGTSCCCTAFCCNDGVMVPNGMLGKLKDHDQFHFLAPGYHTCSNFGQEFEGNVSVAVFDKAVTFGSSGFVIISEGHIGVLLVESTFRLLAPGVYQWENCPSIAFHGSVDVTTSVAKLGPFTLVTVPEGLVAVTYHNGDLRILGWEKDSKGSSSSSAPNPLKGGGTAAAAAGLSRTAQQRTFFLDDPKWINSTFISLKEQTDKLEGNDLLSRDNVEILMIAMSNWRIADPELAIRFAAEDMEKIRTKVNQLVRATIARIVAGTCIGSGGSNTAGVVGHHGAAQGQPVGQQHNAHEDEPDLAHLMQSDAATAHMKDLAKILAPMGIVVNGVYIPERYFKNNDLRQEIARQAVIGIKAEAERSASDASAYATITHARANAEAISEVARAHADAGALLGGPETTAARLALSEATAKALENANVTIFSGAPDQMPFMLTAPTGGAPARR